MSNQGCRILGAHYLGKKAHRKGTLICTHVPEYLCPVNYKDQILGLQMAHVKKLCSLKKLREIKFYLIYTQGIFMIEKKTSKNKFF